MIKIAIIGADIWLRTYKGFSTNQIKQIRDYQ